MGAKTKKSNADAVYSKKSVKSSNPFDTAIAQTAKRLNPFDVHVNKEKFKILGRICKHDRGLPGVSRAKALQKRSETLGRQYAIKHKTNKFVDHRIGKHLSGDQLTESVMNARFLSEKLAQVRASNKAEKFNLNDDELLTHRGQTLEEIEQYRDERSDDEDIDDEGLNAEFTSTAHFGGDGDTPEDRQTAIEEMISEQKRRKNEIAKDKDEVYDLTEKLDANYKELLPLVAKATKDEQHEKPPPDAYDKLLKEMIFEPRGSVTDKLINPEELAKQEAARLDKLENERLRRMKADGEEQEANVQIPHRSADDLDDGYFAAGNEDDGDDILAYDLDGNLGTHLNSKKEAGDATGQSDEKDDESEEDGENDDDDEEETDSDSDVDNLSDLKESDSESDQDEAPQPKNKSKPQKQKTSETVDTSIPYTIKMAKTYEDFTELLAKYTPTQQVTIVERIIKCNHPKLEGVNRENVVKLYAFLLQYIKDMFEDASEQDIRLHFQLVAQLMPHLYDLTHLNPDRMSNTLLDVIREKYAEYRKNHKVYPTLDTLIYFKIVSNLYSTSDFRHPLATPTYIFMQHILSRARVRTRQDIAMGLFIITIALEFGSRSKRLLPAVFNFLLGIVHMAIPKPQVDQIEIAPPFERDGPFCKLLAIPATSESKTLESQKLQAADLVTHTITLDFKVRALDITLRLVKQIFEEQIGEHTGACFLASPFLPLMELLPFKHYPKHVQQHFAEAKSTLECVAAKKMKPLAPPDKKPKALRLLEPRFEVVYDDKRRPKMSKQKEERAKLLHKIKREKKGAIREIRRDTAFVQDLKLKQQLQSDKERHEKVKRIYQEASVQQGELNELARAKKRKKF
ncbi:nucleolar protein 14 homolog [Drosophila novamexicana]|uniref:nucleolar protein 14 homolog n=1 Tax=Drosophila novamexicana TaxID=47314 RepID=UPI0011E5F3BE|nr:nucleolar protein 14 homolog [Drosophila novamexicana]